LQGGEIVGAQLTAIKDLAVRRDAASAPLALRISQTWWRATGFIAQAALI
jgi:hypothetical protein